VRGRTIQEWVIKLPGNAILALKSTILPFAIICHKETRTNLQGFAYIEAAQNLFDFLKFSKAVLSQK
jgi:hypothetical protein